MIPEEGILWVFMWTILLCEAMTVNLQPCTTVLHTWRVHKQNAIFFCLTIVDLIALASWLLSVECASSASLHGFLSSVLPQTSKDLDFVTFQKISSPTFFVCLCLQSHLLWLWMCLHLKSSYIGKSLELQIHNISLFQNLP